MHPMLGGGTHEHAQKDGLSRGEGWEVMVGNARVRGGEAREASPFQARSLGLALRGQCGLQAGVAQQLKPSSSVPTLSGAVASESWCSATSSMTAERKSCPGTACIWHASIRLSFDGSGPAADGEV